MKNLLDKSKDKIVQKSETFEKFKRSVSVIVPTYNAQKYLEETIAHLLLQINVEIEVIVVDDCSSDFTKELVESFIESGKPVRYLRTQSNTGGPAEPRNIGIDAATTNWVAFCDADDLWHPQKLDLQFQVIDQLKPDLVCSAIEDFADGSSPQFLKNPVSENPVTNSLSYWQMLIKDRIATSSVLCRREVLSGSGGFDPSRELVAVEDYDLWLRLMERSNFKVARITTPLVAYRRLGNSLSANKWGHAKKVMRVTRRAAQRGGWLWIYPFIAPLMFTGYCAMSIYWRVIKGSL